MKKIFSIFAAVALVLSAVSCQNPDDAKDAVLEIAGYDLAQSACFGDAVDFTVTAEAAQNVTVALIKDAKQLSTVTVREAQAGVFAGSFDVPYTKNITDGEYDVMIMAMGKASDRAEATVKISLAHPEFTKVIFVAGTEKYELFKSDAASPLEAYKWAYAGKLPAALSGHFEAEDADGKKYVFGGSNVDNVEFGNSADIDVYSYDREIPQGTLSFDVMSFEVKYPLETLWVNVPETTDPNYPGVAEVEFKKGQLVAFDGAGDLWIDVDFFENNGDGTYTFRAEGGKYRLTNQSDWGSLRTERLDSNGDLATFRWDESGNITVNEAIWCLGNYNFGKPDKREIRDGRVFSDWETFDGYCMAKIEDFKYQITLKVYNWAQYKFFCTKLEWGDIYGKNYNIAGSELNGLTRIFNNALFGDGNFQQGFGEADPNLIVYPEEGVVIRFTFDVTDPLGIKVLAEDVTSMNLM